MITIFLTLLVIFVASVLVGAVIVGAVWVVERVIGAGLWEEEESEWRHK